MRTYQIELRELAERTTAVVRSTLALGEIGPFVGHAIEAVGRMLADEGRSPTGPPFARYHRRDEQTFEVEVGFPVVGVVSPTGEVVASTLPGGSAAVLAYVGPYEEMEPAYAALAEWIATHGGTPKGDPWEVYLSDPAQEPDPAQWRTHLVMPFRAT